MPKLRSILDVEMRCLKCGYVARAGDCEGDVDGEGSLGCPIGGCDGIMHETSCLCTPEHARVCQQNPAIRPDYCRLNFQ